MISPARSTTVAWASIKAVSLVAMAPVKPESTPLRHRHRRGLDRKAPGGEHLPGAPGQLAAQAQGGVIEDLNGAGLYDPPDNQPSTPGPGRWPVTP